MIARFTLCLAIGLCLAAAASPASALRQSEAQAAISERIRTAFAAESGVDGFACDIADTACLSEELLERYRIDQWARAQFFSMEICGAYAQSHTQECQMQIMGFTAFNGDVANLARLKQVMDTHGWPQPPAFSREVQIAAWYIAQHGQYIDETGTTQWDAEFAESILPGVREAVERGDMTGWAYGAMFDRIRRTRGEPQRYATQMMCEDGRAVFGALESEADLDARRDAIGMPAFDQDAYDAQCAG